jgi:predicted ATPase
MSLEAKLSAAIDTLTRIYDAEATGPANRDEAQRHKVELERLRGRLQPQTLRTNLLGAVGVGKTSLLTALAGLYVGARPHNVDEQIARSILTIASGRTTAFPVRVRAPQEDEPQAKLGLKIIPADDEELSRVVETVAETELFRLKPAGERSVDERPDRAGEEQRRVVLNMAAYPERKETYSEGNLKRLRIVRPIDDVARQLTALPELTAHLLARIDQTARRGTAPWWFDDSLEDRTALRALFGRINLGEEPAAPLPEEIELIVPWFQRGAEGETLAMLDTRGIDEAVFARADLFEALRDPDAVTVCCSSFVDAPSPRVRELLKALGGDLTLRAARARVILVIIDKGESARLIDAEGDRERGQLSRREECWNTLLAEGLAEGLSLSRVVVFDPLQDEPEALFTILRAVRAEHRAHLEEQALRALAASHSLREGEAANEALRESLDLLVERSLRDYPLQGEPLEDPLKGLKKALADCPLAYRLRAALRWQGTFRNLHLQDAVENTAKAAATLWLKPLQEPLLQRVREERDRQGADAQAYSALLEQLERGFEATVADYGVAVRGEVTAFLKAAPVWREAMDEWGKGKGYRERVVAHFDRWGKLQPFSAHRVTTLAEHIPWLKRLQAPADAPGFTLIADNLRRLKRLRWTLQGVNLLIGANGSGKTTAIAALRFMERVYEVGAANAIVQALGGRANLKSWEAGEVEPVLIALERGQTRWEVVLTPGAAGARVDVTERLFHLGEALLTVSPSGRVNYRGLDLGVAGEDSGLRFLTRLGKIDPPVNRMATLAQSLRAFRVPNLIGLKEQGSNPQHDRRLEPQGGNTFAVLRRFTQAHADHHRLTFVRDGLRLAFPGAVGDLDFQAAGNFLTLNIVPPRGRPTHNIAFEADGVLQLLFDLVAVASAEPGDVVALDQPDDHLHPYAARALLRRVEAWAHRHKLTVILATHSVVLLDAMKGSPERVFVMTPNDDGSVPNALTDLYNNDWLQSFELGELYKNDEIGSNVDDA